jgi:cytochrome c-type protein NapC
MNAKHADGGLRRWWAVLKRPSGKHSLGVLLVVGFTLGILFWGSYNWAVELSNTETFCISCHEMEVNVYEEYRDTIHYNNRTGVRATCPDCHVPKEWHHKMIRKIVATNELFHHFIGSVDTAEKFEAKRLKLARAVWRSMERTDSRECRNCHDYESMDYVAQGRRAVDRHVDAFDAGETCIDCHKGVAHSLPAMHQEDSSSVAGNLR